jgi:hypothetical protein
MIKFVERSTFDGLDDKWLACFAQVGGEDLPLCAVFVDPEELSYHNFENIIRLDSWFDRKKEETKDIQFEMKDMVQIQSDKAVYTFKLGGSLDVLKELHELDLYAKPLNASTRGGKRAIFHSSALSKALTEAIRNSDFLESLKALRVDEEETSQQEDKKAKKAKAKKDKRRAKKKAKNKKEKKAEQSKSFAFVNYVFRLNRFLPKDAKFETHRDTPYYDATRRQVSKYTLIIYLTGGRGDPFALKVSDVTMPSIEVMRLTFAPHTFFPSLFFCLFFSSPKTLSSIIFLFKGNVLPCFRSTV